MVSLLTPRTGWENCVKLRGIDAMLNADTYAIFCEGLAQIAQGCTITADGNIDKPDDDDLVQPQPS
jgi:hypothetical protein